MSEIICECGHSIAHHHQEGCEAFNREMNEYCSCGYQPTEVDVRWQLKQMAAKCDALRAELEMAKEAFHRLSTYDCGYIANNIISTTLQKLEKK